MPTIKPHALSIGLHCMLLVLLLLAASRSTRTFPPLVVPIHATKLTYFRPRQATESRSGGSNRSALPAQHGSPAPTATRTFIPPTSRPNPRLALPITIAFDIPTVDNSTGIGDPLSRLPKGGLGMNGPNGIGDHGCCGGIGDSRTGKPGLSAQRARGVTPPQLVHKVEPEFSEEARKAKYQGIVVLSIEVDANGNVGNVQVLQKLGLGLDEKAIEAVSHWRFRPALADGKPIATEATVQVGFQLL
jgi:periplasmic protein TonB